MLSVGFISSWHVHTNDYAKQLKESGKAKITAMWDEDPVRGKAWAKANGVDFVEDYDAFLARTDVEAVVCNSPTTMHPELLEKAALAKKHIFTEKLLTVDVESCKKLCKIIEDSEIVFTISLPLRSNGKMLYAKQLVDSGVLGKISGARMRRSHGGVSDNWLPSHWFNIEETGGGAMMDLGAHPAYMLTFLFGMPKRISGMTSNLFGTSSDENAIALVEFENGVLATAETAFVTFGVPDILEIYGTNGSLFLRGDEIKLVTKEMQELGVSSISPTEIKDEQPLPLLQFIDACVNGTGTPKYFGTKDALEMTTLIESLYKSDET
ncbi:Gfo/Idh/MocA family oxidoreductase, partial [Lachnospiraceae bacterium OttesenSCG-928-D06]|nr:Gfo/Idh/MocA family oxidoreductase [Lachnospiraceae bacterium OttesenSCG-928-D06]